MRFKEKTVEIYAVHLWWLNLLKAKTDAAIGATIDTVVVVVVVDMDATDLVEVEAMEDVRHHVR